MEFKTGKGRPSKKDLTSKGKGKATKAEDSPEVIIQIGLRYMDPNDEKLKEKRGKRLSVRVKRDSNFKALLETAQEKWKTYHKDLYDEVAEYTLLLDDRQEACFMPGTQAEFFQFNKYKEGIMKDYKRIALFLCSTEDFKESTIASGEESEDSPHCDLHCDDTNLNCTAEPPPKKRTFVQTTLPTQQPNVNSPSTSGLSDASSDALESASKQKRNSEKDPNWFYLDELDRLFSADDSPQPDLSTNHDHTNVDCEAKVVKMLSEKVVTDGKTSLFIVIRRGVTVSRAITLWQRAAPKVNPIHVCHVKFVGEDGIDDGALAREFFSTTVPDIGRIVFPDGCPIYSTNDVSTYRTIGEIVAASIAQGGPAPGFLAPSVYDSLVVDDYSSSDLSKHLTEKELLILESIKQDPAQNTDVIVDHGYTGPITTANVESIVNAVTVSMLSRRQLMLREFKKGLELYGLSEIVVKFPQHCKALFVLSRGS